MKLIFVDVGYQLIGTAYMTHEDGVKIRFPLKLRTIFQLSPRTYKRVGETIVEAQRAFIEKVSIKFIQVPSSCG